MFVKFEFPGASDLLSIAHNALWSQLDEGRRLTGSGPLAAMRRVKFEHARPEEVLHTRRVSVKLIRDRS